MSPRLLLDEMYPPALAELLRDQGHARCLVTENVRDFAILARHTSHGGLLFVNAKRWPRTPAAIKRLADALGQVADAARVPGPGEVGWLS